MEDSTADVIISVELVLLILWQRFVMQTSQRFCLQTSHGEGVSVLNLPSYVFKGVIVTFKKNEMCMCVHIHNEHMDREVKEGSDLVGETVLFTVEDAARKSLKVWNMVLADVSVFLPPSSVKQDMLASLPTLDMAGLTTLIDDQLKTCLLSMTKDQDMCKLVLAVVRRRPSWLVRPLSRTWWPG